MSPDDILTAHAVEKSDINEHLREIHQTVLDTKAQVVVELGVRGGQSTVALLTALATTGGRLYSCDVRDWPATRRMIEGYGLADRWTFDVAHDLVWGKKWSLPIDVLMVDSSHEREHTEAELRLFAPHVRPGGVVLLHDTVSFREGVEGAVHAFMADNEGWAYENRENNNGLGVLKRAIRRPASEGSDRVCRFRFSSRSGLDSTGGACVAVAALSEALRADARFRPMDDNGDDGSILWYPTLRSTLASAIGSERLHGRIAIGPQVLFANAQAPGAGTYEREVMDYDGYAAIFTFSRWYQELLKLNMRQQTRHVLLDYPLPAAWLGEKWTGEIAFDALIYVKGGAEEQQIADALRAAFPSSRVLPYGGFTRAELFEAARTSRVCFYISREDHYPLAAVEIGLMGCPIISDEKACPVLVHRLTGIAAPVRERDTRAPFAWAPDAAERLAAEFRPACLLDRRETRLAVVRRHDPALCVERIAAALGIEARAPGLFDHLRPFGKVIVTGPSRSGTRIASRMIAHDLGYEWLQEDAVATRDLNRLKALLAERDKFVVQCPGLSAWVDTVSGDGTAVVFMRRPVENIIASQRRVKWTDGAREKRPYAERPEFTGMVNVARPIAEIKYRVWDEWQHARTQNAFELQYESLAAHPLWIERERRATFTAWQTEPK